MKFSSKNDAILFAIDEKLGSLSELTSKSTEELVDICESVTKRSLLERRDKVEKIVDREKSRMMTKKWVNKRRNFMKGINRFHKSIKGRRVHEKLSSIRKNGSDNINESFTTINSLLTRLSINSSYTSSLIEEANNQMLLQEAYHILNPVLADIVEGKVVDINERLNEDESGIFIDDLIGVNTDILSPGDVSAEDILSRESPAEKLLRDPMDNPNINEDDDEDPENDDAKGDGSNSHESSKVNSSEVSESYKASDNKLVDIVESFQYDVSNEYTMITESTADPDVDGEHVIAKIIGPAFFPDTTSRNRVEYSRELWDAALSNPEFVRELAARRVYGTFGHATKIDDTALLNGDISHILKDVWINERNVGIAEYLVLNTGPGRNLKTYLGAGSKLRVSTRCRGAYLHQRNMRGNKVPDPKAFFLRGIDFVYDPGYLEAEPTLSVA